MINFTDVAQLYNEALKQTAKGESAATLVLSFAVVHAAERIAESLEKLGVNNAGASLGGLELLAKEVHEVAGALESLRP